MTFGSPAGQCRSGAGFFYAHRSVADAQECVMEVQAAAQQAEATGAVEEPLDSEQEPTGQTPDPVEDGAGEGQGDDLGFPADTAIDDMEEGQKTAYWKNQSKVQQRKYEAEVRAREAAEAEVARLRLAALPEAERVAAEAREQALAEARVEARKELLPTLVIAELRSRGLSQGDAAERVEFLDLSKLVDEQGELVADRLDKLAPAVGATRHQGQPSPQQAFQQAGGAPTSHRISLSPDAIADRAAQIKNKH